MEITEKARMALRAVFDQMLPRDAPGSWLLRGSPNLPASITKIAPEAALAVAASTSLRGLWGDLDVVPHGSQPVCQIDGGAVMVQLIEVTRSEFAVVGSAGEHVVGRH